MNRSTRYVSSRRIENRITITKIDDNQFSYIVAAAPANPSANGSSKKEMGSGWLRFANTKIDLGLFIFSDFNIAGYITL